MTLPPFTLRCQPFAPPSLGELRVEETGQGIASELVDKLFDPFFTKDEGEDTGLELPICQGVVEAHGGESVPRTFLDGAWPSSFSYR